MAAQSVDPARSDSDRKAKKNEIMKQSSQAIPIRMRWQARAFNWELFSCAFVFPAIRFLNANVRSEGHISGACPAARLLAPREMISRREFLFTEHLHVAPKAHLFFPLTHRPTTPITSASPIQRVQKNARNGTTFRFRASMHTVEAHEDRF